MNKILPENINFQEIVDNAPDIIILLGRDLQIGYINKAIEKITPFSSVFLCKKTSQLIDLFGEESASLYTWLQQVFDMGENAVTEYQLTTPHKTGIFQLHAVPLFNQDSSVENLLLLMRDVSDYRFAEAALQDSTKLLDEIFEKGSMMLAYMDTDFNFIKVSKTYAQADERDVSFYTGKNHFDLYPHYENRTIFLRVIETGKPYRAIARPFVYEGSPERGITYWDWTLLPIKNKNGSIYRILLMLVDVTSYKKMEAELIKFSSKLEDTVRVRTAKLSETHQKLQEQTVERTKAEEETRNMHARLDQIFNVTPVGISLIDLDCNIIRVNQQFLRMFDFEEEQVVEKKCYNVWDEWICQTDNCPLQRIKKGREFVSYEINKKMDFQDISCYVSVVPFRSHDGNLIGIIKNCIDITEKKNIQNEYIRAVVSERQRIGNNLHDLVGQDLTAVSFMLQSLKKKFDVTLIEDITQLVRNAITQTKDISRLLSPVDIGNTALKHALIEMASSMSKIYNVKCIVHDEGEVFIQDHAIATHLYYIAREAMNNAFKYARADRIDIFLRKYHDELHLTVQDDGTGIIDQEKGTGMGLKIMAYRADLIGATFTAANSGDKGFTVKVIVHV